MASSSFLERKLRKLNCIKNQQHYGSVETIDSVEATPVPKKQFKLFGKKFGKKSTHNNAPCDFTVSYEHENADERTQLLAGSSKKKQKYSNIGEDGEDKKSNKKSKKSVKFDTTDGKDKKSKKKKSSLLKRTGKMIVRTCRLMSYGTPYMTHMAADFPYNTRYPPDYRYYDFETKSYDFGYSNNYMGYNGASPSVFF